jgi:hypothetical protein
VRPRVSARRHARATEATAPVGGDGLIRDNAGRAAVRMKTVAEFIAKRKSFTNEFFPAPGSRRTVLVSSDGPLTELMAYAAWKLGFNVLVAEPWSAFFADERRFVTLDNVFRRWVETLRKFNVQLAIGGNATAMLPHPKTRELLHRAAGIPAVHYWYDEPRVMHPMTGLGYTAGDYLAGLRDPRTLNVFWDGDVAEEVRRFLAVPNVAHVPLGVTPELWDGPIVPLKDRPVTLGFATDRRETAAAAGTPPAHAADTVLWAERVARLKLSEPDRSTVACIEQVGGPGESRGSTARRPYELAPTLREEFQRWDALNGALARDGRDPVLAVATARLGERFVVRNDAVDFPRLHATSRASLNLVGGGATHGGLPGRAFAIPAAGGLLLCQYARELPGLFEPGRECVAFRTPDEMLAAVERIEASPAEFDAVAEAGRRRALAEHTWDHRMSAVLQLAKDRFDLPW